MPELPDVEVYRRRLERDGLHRRIRRADLRDPTALRATDESALAEALTGRELVATDRRGKHLFAATSGPGTLVLHFGMTGVLTVDEQPRRDAHERLTLELEDGAFVHVVDPRRLGFVAVTSDVGAYCREHDLGPDALDLDLAGLRRLVTTYRGGVKSLLMDQRLLAGVGNIYSDEICFQARIDPRRRCESLDENDVRRLHRQLRRVLTTAADRGADPERFPAGWLLRHRDDHAACPRCGGQVRRVRIAGRGAYLCPGCQH